MNSAIRWLVLGVFAAGGVGIAVCTAVSSTSADTAEATRKDDAASKSVVNAAPAAAKPRSNHASPRDEQPAIVTSATLLQPPVAVPYGALNAPSAESSQPFSLQLTPANNFSANNFAPVPPSPYDVAPRERIVEAAQQQVADLMSQAKANADANAHSEDESPEEALSIAPTRNGSGSMRPRPLELAQVPKAASPKGNSTPPKADRNRISREGDDHLAIHIQDMDIREVLELLSEQGGINILASNNVLGKVSASLKDVDIDTALAAILRSTGFSSRRDGQFIYVGTQQDFQSLEQNLDRIGTRIYRPNYVRASDIQHLITPLLTATIGSISVTAQAEIGITPDNNKAGGDNFAGSEAVLVKDYEAVLAQVDQVVAEIDKRPLQVHIEAMIMSVKLDDENSMGVNFALLRDQAHLRLASGTPLADIGQVSFQKGGLTFGFLDSTLGVFVNALETIGDTNVIATPQLLCLNKQRSEILIGAQLGYVSTTVTETSTAQKVEFLEIGTQLRIRPFISSDGMVRMEVHPELSTGTVQIQGNFTLPEKDVTQVTTNVMARDGCTVVIGGLMRNDLITTASQIPLLGSLPGVGFLFRQKKETIQRSEIIVLITPHIVYDEACCAGEKAACEFQRRQSVYADEMSPIGKRYLGRKYFRLAQQAFAAGDDPRALRFANLSIHFDPLSRAAIDLRADIWHGDHSGPYAHPPIGIAGVGSGVQPADAGALPPWVLNDLEGTPARPASVPLHPRDPGVPGSNREIQKPQKLR